MRLLFLCAPKGERALQDRRPRHRMVKVMSRPGPRGRAHAGALPQVSRSPSMRRHGGKNTGEFNERTGRGTSQQIASCGAGSSEQALSEPSPR